MSAEMKLILLIGLAYVLGSIPFGLLVGLSKGIDPRKSGSGNIGATNVGRLLGGKFFAIVFVLDLLKGALPTVLASVVMRDVSLMRMTPGLCALWLAVGFAAIVGHMFSLFIKFQGGKGVATSVGVMLGIYPCYTMACGVVLLAWGICFAMTRIVSLSSMVGAVVFPMALIGLDRWQKWGVMDRLWPLLAFAVAVGAMVIVKHRSNIRRLIAGTEMGVGKKRDASTGA